MNKQSFDQLTQQAIDETVDRLLLPRGVGVVTEPQLRQALAVLVQRIASHARAYELLGIRTSTDLAEEWQVSRRRAQAFIASLHKRHGVGWKIGGMWCLSAEEAETHRPADHAGRPVQ